MGRFLGEGTCFLYAAMEISLIADFFKGLDRQGPGDDPQTRMALELAGNLLPDKIDALDIGCGTGRQTAVLASMPGIRVTAVDLLPVMVDGMLARMAGLGLCSRVEGVVASMDSLPFGAESFDLIWAEGSIYNIGFRRGLAEWRRLLRSGGCIAVTECSWLTGARPSSGMDSLEAMFPEMKTVVENISAMQETGYIPVAHFVLPECCWTDNYYIPMERRIGELTGLYRGDGAVKAFTDSLREEIRCYREFGSYYGYVFYIGQKPGF